MGTWSSLYLGPLSRFTAMFLVLLLSFLACSADSNVMKAAECGETILLSSDHQEASFFVTDRRMYSRSSDNDQGDNDCLVHVRSPPSSVIDIELVAGERDNDGSQPPIGLAPAQVFITDGLAVDDGIDEVALSMNGSLGNASFTSTGRDVTCRITNYEVHQDQQITIRASMTGIPSAQASNPGECGGTITLDQNTPTAVFNATNSYPSGGAAYCTWYVNGPANTKVLTTFKTFRLDTYDSIRIYDSQGRYIFYVKNVQRTPAPIVTDGGYVRILFDAYYSTSNTLVEMEVSYTNKIETEEDGVLSSSGGVIELTSNTPSVTIQSAALDNPSNSATVYLAAYWYVRCPLGSTIAVRYHSVSAGALVYFHAYDSDSTSSRRTASFSAAGETQLDLSGTVFSSNSATFYMYSNQFLPEQGVNFTISIADSSSYFQDSCGGPISLSDSMPEVFFSTPFYLQPLAAEFYMDCLWYIMSPLGDRVTVTLSDVNISSSDDISVCDHPTSYSSSYLISEISGNLKSNTTVYSSQEGLLIYYDDYQFSHAGPGFHGVARIFDELPDSQPGFCGGVLALTDAQPALRISSPLYNIAQQELTVGVELDCWMHITSPLGKQVQLTFMALETINEKIYVYDHPSSTSGQIFYAYGTLKSNATMYSSQGGFTLVFSDSSNSYNGPGFIAEAVIITDSSEGTHDGFCAGVVSLSDSSPRFSFTTPLYHHPSSLPLFLESTMYFRSPLGEEVQLSVLDLNTTNEKVILYDYPTSRSNLISELAGRMEPGATVYSSNGGITLFYDDSSSGGNGPGFYAEAKILDSQEPTEDLFCGGTIALTESRPSFTFSTPFFNNPRSIADVTAECWMYISCPLGKQIQLTFESLETSNEHVIVYDYPSYSSSYQVAYLYGTLNTSVTVYSTRNGLTLRYDDISTRYNGPGFLAEAHIIDEVFSEYPEFCGGTIDLSDSEPSVIFWTPQYYNPSTYYNDIHMDCRQYITSPLGKQVLLTFLDIQTREYEKIRVYDHPTSTSNLVSYLYGTINSNVTVLSSNGGLMINFDDSSSSYNRPGFRALVEIVDSYNPEYIEDFCGGVIDLTDNHPNITLATPLFNHPSLEDVFLECYMHLTSPLGRNIRLNVLDVDTVSEEVEFYDHPTSVSSSYIISRISGRLNSSAVMYPSSGGITVFYDDNSSGENGRGLLMEAQLIDESPSVEEGLCGGTLSLSDTRRNMTFSSPLYPYPSSMGVQVDCWLHLVGPSTGKVKLTFLDMETVSTYMTIYEHSSSTSTSYKVGYMYGTLHSPVSFVSAYRGFTLVIDDSSSNNGPGFLAQFSVSDETASSISGLLGGTVSLTEETPNITFTTPLYYEPSITAGVLTDGWLHITSPVGKQIQLTMFDLETTPSEQIRIYDSPTLTSSSYKVSYLYGTLNASIVVLSSRGGLTIYYDDSSSSWNGRGFRAEAKLFDETASSISGLFGGTVSLTEETPNITFTTPLYHEPSTTAGMLTDGWLHITSPVGKQVQLTMFDLETTSSEKITIYDSPTSTSSSYKVSYLYGTLNDSIVVLSSRGGLTIYYDDSSSSWNGRGFRAEAKLFDVIPSTIEGFCGGVLPLSDSVQSVALASPTHQQQYPSPLYMDCTMYFTSPAGQQLLLTMLDVDTLSEDIDIYDYPTSTSYQVASLTGSVKRNTSVLSSRGGFTVRYDDNSYNPNGRGFRAIIHIQDSPITSKDGFCGGSTSLTNSNPRVVITTPFYSEGSSEGVVMNCWWYISSATSSEVEMSVEDINTKSEIVYVYDHPSSMSSSYQILSLTQGTVTVLSTRRGFGIKLYDSSSQSNGRGFLVRAKLEGSHDETTTTSVIASTTPSEAETSTPLQTRAMAPSPFITTAVSQNVTFRRTPQPHPSKGPDPDLEGIILTCTDMQMIVDIPKSLLSDGVQGSHSRFANEPDADNQDCWGVDTQNGGLMDIIRLTTNLTACGTIMTETDDEEVYTNRVINNDAGSNLFTYKHTIDIPVSCSYNRTQRVGSRVYQVTDYVIDKSISEEGQYSFNFDMYSDGSFEHALTEYPLPVELDDKLHLAASVLSLDGTLDLSIQSCRATPTSSYENQVSYDFIDNGCSVDTAKVNLTHLAHNRVGVEMHAFRFIGEGNNVYIHCTVLVCDARDPFSLCNTDCVGPAPPAVRQRRDIGRDGTGALDTKRFTRGPLQIHTLHSADNSIPVLELSDGSETQDSKGVSFALSPLVVVMSAIATVVLVLVVGLVMKMRHVNKLAAILEKRALQEESVGLLQQESVDLLQEEKF